MKATIFSATTTILLSGCLNTMPPECSSTEVSELLKQITVEQKDLVNFQIESSKVKIEDIQTVAIDEKLKRRNCVANIYLPISEPAKESLKKEMATNTELSTVLKLGAMELQLRGVDPNTKYVMLNDQQTEFTVRMGEGQDKDNWIVDTTGISTEFMAYYGSLHVYQALGGRVNF